MIHHVISAAIVAFVVGAVLILQNKIEDLQTELTDLNKKENELKTECVQFQAKVEFMEKSFDSLKASLDTIAVHTKRKEEQGKYITQYKYCIASNQLPLCLLSHYPMSRAYQNFVIGEERTMPSIPRI